MQLSPLLHIQRHLNYSRRHYSRGHYSREHHSRGHADLEAGHPTSAALPRASLYIASSGSGGPIRLKNARSSAKPSDVTDETCMTGTSPSHDAPAALFHAKQMNARYGDG